MLGGDSTLVFSTWFGSVFQFEDLNFNRARFVLPALPRCCFFLRVEPGPLHITQSSEAVVRKVQVYLITESTLMLWSSDTWTLLSTFMILSSNAQCVRCLAQCLQRKLRGETSGELLLISERYMEGGTPVGQQRIILLPSVSCERR